jgi:hypothetical protein
MYEAASGQLSALESRYSSQLYASLARQRTLLYFHHPRVPTCPACKARQMGSQRCQLCYCHHHHYYCPRQTPRPSPGRCRRREIAVHAECWRRRPLPASLTQTLPLGCSQTALSVRTIPLGRRRHNCSRRAAHDAHLPFSHVLFLSSRRVPTVSSFHCLKPARPDIATSIRFTEREHASPDHRLRALVVGPCYTTCNVKISTKYASR